MNCKEAKILFAPHILGDLDNEPQRCKELQAHLLCCPNCYEMYDGFKETIGFVLAHKAEFAQAFENARAREKKIDVPIPSPASFPTSRKIFIKASAVAAGLLIGVSLWMIFSIYSNPQNLPQDSSSQQVASVDKSSLKVELVANTGNIPIPSGEQITSASQSKTLLINGKHKMIMNTNTVLAVEPLVEHGNIGCLVKFTSGQIYADVAHDGNPFIVNTVHGKAVITGTTFDVKVTDDSTTLVVSEGAVQFESEKVTVKVVGGQTSRIIGQSTPSIPISCNATVLTAWATGYSSEDAYAQTKPIPENYDITDLPLSLAPKPIVLEETDYDHWVEQKRNWFRQEFLWIFQLKDALAKEGIEVDYPELLIKTGDVWQFAFLETVPVRFSVIGLDSLLRTASDYGFDKQWLLENVPAAKSAQETPTLSENSLIGLKAFERWLKCLDKTNELEPPTLIYSFCASKYLAETRSLIWLAVRDGKYDLPNEKSTETLALLQEEVTALCKCQNQVLYPTEEKKRESSCEDKCKGADCSIIRYIETVRNIEERILEYEIYKQDIQ